MPPTSVAKLPVTGTASTDSSGIMLVLAQRLEGHNTFLTGTLEIDNGWRCSVRILTLDDVTVLRLTEASPIRSLQGRWSGTLHLPHGLRTREVPADLIEAASRRRRDLTFLDEAELRYALTFLQEATTEVIRLARIDAIVAALPTINRSTKTANMLISLDVGGTLGYSESPSLATVLASVSPLSLVDARRIMRTRLHTVPEISDAVITDVCHSLRIPRSAFPRNIPASTLMLMPGAIDTVRKLSYYGIVTTLSNVTCVDADIEGQRELFSPWITDHFPSYSTGYCKPDPRAFQGIANTYGLTTSQMVHVGDNWECDIAGALDVGAKAIWVSAGRPVPDARLVAHGDVLVVETIDQVTPLVHQIAGRRS